MIGMEKINEGCWVKAAVVAVLLTDKETECDTTKDHTTVVHFSALKLSVQTV